MEKNWKSFESTAMYIPEENLTYQSWLQPVEYANPISFETFSHVTTFENANNILMTELKSFKVNDHSCITRFPSSSYHPLQDVRILWVNADDFQNSQAEKHGNIRFFTTCLDFIKPMNFYVVEFIDNCLQPVARVLVTGKKYPQLRHFNINVENDGPIFLDSSDNWMKYISFKRKNWSFFEEFKIEIMLESPGKCNSMFDRINYVKCVNPKSIIKNDRYVKKIEAYDCDFGELRYTLFHFKHRFENKYTILGLTASTQQCIQTIVTTELTRQWYPLKTRQFCSNNSPNYLIRHLAFDKSLYQREIQWEDEGTVEDLHYIFTRSGELPDALTMISKIMDSVGKMRYHRSFKEVFELFIDHFKSEEAQARVQEAIIKFIFFH